MVIRGSDPNLIGELYRSEMGWLPPSQTVSQCAKKVVLKPLSGKDGMVEGAEHDGIEPDVCGEPSFGWTCAASEGKGTWGGDNDREADGSHLTEAARQRYKPFDRYGHSNPDGMHVDVERGFGRSSRRLVNLSDQQREALAPRITWGEVRI